MASTKISDVIVPEVFDQYMIERTAELTAFWGGGIVSRVENLGLNGREGGDQIKMPFWQDLSGDSEVLDDSTPLTVNPITTGQDLAVLHTRGKAWGANDLAGALAGDDPMTAIGNLAADYWLRQNQKILINTLEGAFSAANIGSNVYDISGLSGGAEFFGPQTFVDACYAMGDANTRLTAVAMHSATSASATKQDMVSDVELPSTIETPLREINGKRLIEDDSMPVSTDVYTTYIFGEGAVGYSPEMAPEPSETFRDELASESGLVTRTHHVLHPRGIAWTGTPTGTSPSFAEMANGANWNRVWENKNIRIVKFVHKIAP